MSKSPQLPPPPGGQFLVYRTPDGKLKIEVRFDGDTVWLTQQLMADLFQTTQQNISLHLQNIYAEGELQREATHKEFLSVRREGSRDVTRSVDFYNLVEQYLVFAEGQAMRRIPMYMADWIWKLDAFLALNERDILTHAGRISHEAALARAESEYERFKSLNASQRLPVDDHFDEATKQLPELSPPAGPKRTSRKAKGGGA